MPGAALLALRGGVPVVPCGLDTCGWSKRSRRPCVAVFGEPIRIDGLPVGREGVELGTRRIAQGVEAARAMAVEASAAGCPAGAPGWRTPTPVARRLAGRGRKPRPCLGATVLRPGGRERPTVVGVGIPGPVGVGLGEAENQLPHRRRHGVVLMRRPSLARHRRRRRVVAFLLLVHVPIAPSQFLPRHIIGGGHRKVAGPSTRITRSRDRGADDRGGLPASSIASPLRTRCADRQALPNPPIGSSRSSRRTSRTRSSCSGSSRTSP
jgi:hypothetical protein